MQKQSDNIKDKKKLGRKIAKIGITALLFATPFLQSIGGVISLEASVPVVGKTLAKNAIANAATTTAPYTAPTITAAPSLVSPDTTLPKAATDALTPDQINNGFPSISNAIDAGSLTNMSSVLPAPFSSTLAGTGATTQDTQGGTINPKSGQMSASTVNVVVLGTDGKPYIVYSNNGSGCYGGNGITGYYATDAALNAAVQYINYEYSLNPTVSSQTDYMIVFNANLQPTTAAGSSMSGTGSSMTLASLGGANPKAHSITITSDSTANGTSTVDPTINGAGNLEGSGTGTAGTAVAASSTTGVNYKNISLGKGTAFSLYLGVPTVIRNINLNNVTLYAQGNPVAFQNSTTWGNDSTVYGGTDGSTSLTASSSGAPVAATSTSPASSGGSSIWFYSTGTFSNQSNVNINFFGGNLGGSFTGDSHVTIAGMNNYSSSNGLSIQYLVGGNGANGGTFTGNTNVDINTQAQPTVQGVTAPKSSGVGNLIAATNSAFGTGTSAVAYHSGGANGVVAGGSIAGTVSGSTRLTIQSTGAGYTIGSLPWWSSGTKTSQIAGQSATSGVVTAGNVSGNVTNNTNLNITGVGAGTWIPQIYGAGIGQASSSSAPTTISSTMGASVGNNVRNLLSASAVYGVFIGGTDYGTISGSITNTLSGNGAWGLLVKSGTAWGFTSTGAASISGTAEKTGTNASNQNANFGENITNGVYGSYIGGSVNGNIGTAGTTNIAISNNFDDSGFTDGFAFFTGGNDGIMHMGTANTSATLSNQNFVYGVSSGTINGTIANKVKAGTSVNTAAAPPANSWAGDLEGFTGGNGSQSIPLTAATSGVNAAVGTALANADKASLAVNNSSNAFNTVSGAANQSLSTKDKSTLTGTASSSNASQVNGSIYSNLVSGVFSIGNSADNATPYNSAGTTNGVSTDNYSSGVDNTWEGVVRGGSYFGYDAKDTVLAVGTGGVVSSTWGFAKLGVNGTLPTMAYSDTNSTQGDVSGFEITGSGGTATAKFEGVLSTYVQGGTSSVILGNLGGATASTNNSGAIAAAVYGGVFNGYQCSSSKVYVNSGIYSLVMGGSRNAGVQWGDSQVLMANGQVNTAVTGGSYDTNYQVGSANTEIDGGTVNGSVFGTLQVSGWYAYDSNANYVPYALSGNTNVLITGGDFTGSPTAGTDLSGKTIVGGSLSGSVQGNTNFVLDTKGYNPNGTTAVADTMNMSTMTTWQPGCIAFQKKLPFVGGGAPTEQITNASGSGQFTISQTGSGANSSINMTILGNSISVLSNAQIEGDSSTLDETNNQTRPTGASVTSGNYTANGGSSKIAASLGMVSYNASNIQFVSPSGTALNNHNHTDWTNIGNMNINVNAPMDNFGNIFASSYTLVNAGLYCGSYQPSAAQTVPTNLASPNTAGNGLQYNVNINIQNAGQIQNISGGWGYGYDPTDRVLDPTNANFNSDYTKINTTIGNGNNAVAVADSTLKSNVANGTQMTAANAPVAVSGNSKYVMGSGRGVDNFTAATVGGTNKSTINFSSTSAGKAYVSNLVENFTNLNVGRGMILSLTNNPDTAIAAAAADPYGDILTGSGALTAAQGNTMSNATYTTNVTPFTGFATTSLADGSGIYTDYNWGGSTTTIGAGNQLSQQMFLGALNVTGETQLATPYLTTDREINIDSLKFSTDAATSDVGNITWYAKNNNILNSDNTIKSGNTNPTNGLAFDYSGNFWSGGTKQGMPLLTFTNTNATGTNPNGITTMSPQNVVGYDANSSYGYGLLSDYDTADAGNKNGTTQCTSDTIFIQPGQIRQMTVDNSAAGNWELNPNLVSGTGASIVQGTPTTNMLAYSNVQAGVKSTTISLYYEDGLFNPSGDNNTIVYPNGVTSTSPQTSPFWFTANSGYFLTNVELDGPLEKDTGNFANVYSYNNPGVDPTNSANNTTDSGSLWPQAASDGSYPFSPKAVTSAASSNLVPAVPVVSTPTSTTRVSGIGALSSFSPNYDDSSYTYFPGNSTTGSYADNPSVKGAGGVSSRYVIYKADTSNANTIKANNIILTETEAENLTLPQLESSSYQPVDSTNTILKDTQTTFAYGMTNGATVIATGANGETLSSSAISMGSGQLADINNGLQGQTSRVVNVTWTEPGVTNSKGQPVTASSKVTIVEDGTTTVDNTAVISSHNLSMAAIIAQNISAQATAAGVDPATQLANYTQASVALSDGTTTTPMLVGWSAKLADGTTMGETSNTAKEDSYQTLVGQSQSDVENTLFAQLDQAGNGDTYSIYYQYTIPASLDASQPVLKSASTISINAGQLGFSNVPTSVDFGSKSVSVKNVKAHGNLGNSLVVSDTRPSYTGWTLTVSETQALNNGDNNLAGDIYLNTTGNGETYQSGTAITGGAGIIVPCGLDAQAQAKLPGATTAWSADTTDENTVYAQEVKAAGGTSTSPKDGGTLGTFIGNLIFPVSSNWNTEGYGLYLYVPAKQQVAGSYSGVLTWTLGDTASDIQ